MLAAETPLRKVAVFLFPETKIDHRFDTVIDGTPSQGILIRHFPRRRTSSNGHVYRRNVRDVSGSGGAGPPQRRHFRRGRNPSLPTRAVRAGSSSRTFAQNRGNGMMFRPAQHVLGALFLLRPNDLVRSLS